MASKITTQLVIDGKNNSKQAIAEARTDLLSLSSVAKSAGAVLAGALSVGILSSWVKGSVDAIDKTDELAERAGMLAGEFSGLQYAAQFASIEGEALSSTLGKFNQTISKAADGSKAQVEAFEQIGVSVRDTGGQVKGTGQLLLEVADKFAALPDGPQKAALAIQLFGKQGAKLLPLLNKGGAGITALTDQARDLGLVLSDETYKAAGQFNDNLDVLASVAEGAGQQVAANLLPALNDVTGLMVDLSTSSTATVDAADVLGFGLKALATIVVILGVALKTTGDLLGGLMAALLAAAQGDLSGALDVLRDATLDYAKTTEEGIQRVTKLWNGEYAATGAAAAKTAQTMAASFDEAVSGMGRSAEDATDHMEHLKAVQKQIVKDAQDALSKQVAEQRKANAELAKAKQEQLDTAKRYKDALTQLNAGPAEEPSYGAAEDLKVGARNALQRGDVDEAKRQAQAALEILMKLSEAGGNTYGFGGFIKELQGIEEAADAIKVDNAQSSADAAAASVAKLKAEIEAVKDVKVTINLTPEEVAKITADIQRLAASLGQQMVITATVVTPDGTAAGAAETAPGYAVGTNNATPGLRWVGERGPELLAFNGGERVFTASASKNLASRLAGMAVPSVGGGALKDAAMSTPGAQPGRDLGRVDLHTPDGQVIPLLADADTFGQLLRTQKDKRGNPRRRN